MRYRIVQHATLIGLPQHPGRSLQGHASFAKHTRRNVKSVQSKNVNRRIDQFGGSLILTEFHALTIDPLARSV